MSITGNAETKVLRGRINRLDTLCISAYAIAVQNGFEGTEEEWLASLKGEKGADGEVVWEELTEEQIASLRGKDGVSVTHRWDGTVLTITSASGTSSADLKGEKGDSGEGGGTSTLIVTVENDIASHTSAEIYAHVQNGGSAVLSGANIDFLPLASASNNACIFGGNMDVEHDMAANYVVYAGKEVESFFANYARTQNIPKTLIVTIQQDGTASHTAMEIDMHVRSGGTVMFSPNGADSIALTFCNQYTASFFFTSIEENIFDEYIIYQDGTIETFSRTNADMDNIPTDAHINSLIDTKLGVIENGTY